MNRNFARALALVLKHEGGWSDHPADPGGATMKGVTLANFRRYVKPGATKDDLRKITDEQLATVYRRFYWDAIHGAELPDGVDYAVFDYAVNSGPGRAAKYLQGVVGVVQDGRIGPATLSATRAMMRATVINDLCDNRMEFLRGLNTWPTFGRSWTARVSGVRADALKLSAPPQPRPTTPEPKPAPAAAPIPAPAPEPARGWLSRVLAWLFSQQNFLGPLLAGKVLDTVIGRVLDKVAINPKISLEPTDVPAVREVVAETVRRELEAREQHSTNSEPAYQSRVAQGSLASILGLRP